jgi:hypothetical protein
MINLKLDLHEIRRHAQDYMRELGIEYQHATPQSITDSWWFWNCTNVPSPLPKGLKVLNIKPREAIGWGLSAEIADALEKPEQEPPALFTKYGPPTMRDRDFWSAGYAAATARAIEAALKERNA